MSKQCSQEEILRRHQGGKVAIQPLVEIKTIDDLRVFYTPGVAQVCHCIEKNPQAAREYTAIAKTVCIATNGSAVLGLGNIGPLAGLPVMEGKSLILHKMAGISCVPILLESDNAVKIIDTLAEISKSFGAIMIEDIKAPLCFEVEKGLQDRLSIPVFHDDQHGTAIVVLAALIKSLKLLKKDKMQVRIAVNGAGAAGMAICKTLLKYGFKHIVLCDTKGAIYSGRKEGMNPYKEEIAGLTNEDRQQGGLADIIKGKDIFIGVSAAGQVTGEMVRSMNPDPIVLALANPTPEIYPEEALAAGAAIASDGRTVNNCLVFPGLMLGALRSCAREVTFAMKIKAAETIAGLAPAKDILPDFMDLSVHQKVADAVTQAAKAA